MRICFAGTFNSGKTTAFQELKKELEESSYNFLPERARYHHSKGKAINEKGSFLSQKMFLDELHDFLSKHKEAICEDSPYSILAYIKLYYNSEIDIQEEIKKFSNLIDRVVLFDPIKPIENDGVRMTCEIEQERVQDEIVRQIYKYNVVGTQVIDQSKLKEELTCLTH